MARLVIDWKQDGRQQGYLELPSSTNTSAWQSLRIPVFYLRGGAGPTTLLLGGAHGDEYESQIALAKFAHTIDASEVEGSLIIIPSLNVPAALAGTRLSSIDDCNLNREFPGNSRGSVTQRLAHFITSELIPRSDTVVDLHSGGRTLRFHPCMFIHEQKTAEQTAKVIAAAQSFGAPFTVVAREDHADVMIDDVVERAGKLMISSELGGSGIVTPYTVDLTYGGLYRLLKHLGHIREIPAGLLPPEESRLLFVPGSNYFVHADDTVLFQPLVELGQPVQEGEIFGYYHYIDRLKPATPVRAPATGVLLCVNGQALVRRDDTVAVIAVAYES